MFKQLLNAGEDVLVFYNDNKASFQQFVDMMRNERNQQYHEEMQILSGTTSKEFKKSAGKELQNKLTGGDFQESGDTVITDDSLTRDGVAEDKKQYENSNDHGALRLVCSFI